jgi:hypothetical protein
LNEYFIDIDFEFLRRFSLDHPYFVDALYDNIRRQGNLHDSELAFVAYDSNVILESSREDDWFQGFEDQPLIKEVRSDIHNVDIYSI